MKQNKGGFGAVEGLLVLVIVGLVGFVGWYVWHAKQNTDKTLNTASTTSAVTPLTKKPLDKTYTDTAGKFILKYPSDWKVKNNDNGTFITSPAGTELNITVRTTGGVGFECISPDHPCSTLTYKTAEDIGQKALLITDEGNGLIYKKVPLYLVSLTEVDKNNVTTYYVGLTDDAKAKTQLNKPLADSGTDFGNFLFNKDTNDKSAYPLISIYASSKSGNFLTSTDANTLKEILKTFTYIQ